MKAVTTRLNAARKKLKEAMFMLKARRETRWREEEGKLRELIKETEDVMMKLGEKDLRKLNLDRTPRKKEREDLVTKMIARKHTSRTITEKRRLGQR